MKKTAISLVIFFLAGCMVKTGADVGELPMFLGIEKGKDYVLTKEDEKFVSQQISNYFVDTFKAGEIWIRKGFMYYADGDLKMAMKHFNRAWLLDRYNPKVYFGFAVVLSSQNQQCNAQKMVDLAFSKGQIEDRFLPGAAYTYTACLRENNALSDADKTKRIKRADQLFIRAFNSPTVEKKYTLRQWVRSMYDRGDNLGAWEKTHAYEELTGRTLEGKVLASVADPSGELTCYTPLGAREGYNLGAIVDYGYTGHNHKLLFSKGYLIKETRPEAENALADFFYARLKPTTHTFDESQKALFLSAIKRSLVSGRFTLSNGAKNAVYGIKKIEISAESAIRKNPSSRKSIQNALKESINGGALTGIVSKIARAKNPIIITKLLVYKAATVKLYFDKGVDISKKMEIFDKVSSINDISVKISKDKNLVLKYLFPTTIAFKGYKLDSRALSR